MNESKFHELADAAMLAIEQAIDDAGADIDYETTGNVMTLEFENRSQIIINRQEPMREIWLASQSGGYHFQYQENRWICSRSGEELMTLVKRECEKHAEETIDWA
ncbi:Iron-sulfur cluster assembly protein CyaY [Vibrio stylophorae]|uniref:Iron-sulfur cluster assembly protein CyaY n=1 Tax=Vibrio stylophorae TaxID=659351 RepID=A0ABM8ZWM5_9VIBR|nr:iron donor protein CyaY [Vibrio stylophorae]CAH0534734.1 Iron-sulfur cluster assembly protein CyaY [Vibrio stylophorae]